MRERLLLLVVLLLTLAGHATTARAQDAAPVDLGAYAQPLRFEAAEGSVLEVEGAGPEAEGAGRYVEAVEVRLGPDGGLTLVNDVSMRHYLEGLDEVPVDWPEEALKAQVVAARTYAWYVMHNQSYPGYDICATVACQVFHGREPVEEPLGQRWAQAVEATEGEVLTYEGQPILARYSSTSGGATRDNEDVFPGEGAYPYLKGVPDPEDSVSPLHEWQVRFAREELDAVLARGQQLSAAVPLADITLVPATPGRTDRVRVTGQDGSTAEVPASRFRSFVSEVAPELFPERYPSDRPDGRRLPMTLPSSRLSFTVTEDEVIIDGRGFGHGVGMSQYGAKGKAEAGMGYGDILAAYYQGLRPHAHPAVPDRVRVGVATGADSSVIRSDQPFRVVAGDREITARGLGTWRVTLRPDRTMGLTAPTGYGAPLVVDTTTVARPAPDELEVVAVETVVNKAAELYLAVTRPDGQEVVRQRLGVVEAGRHERTWDLDGADGAQLAPGPYRVALEAVDEDGDRQGAPAPVTIHGVPAPPDGSTSLLGPLPSRSGTVGWLVAAAIGAAVGGAGAMVRGREAT